MIQLELEESSDLKEKLTDDDGCMMDDGKSVISFAPLMTFGQLSQKWMH